MRCDSRIARAHIIVRPTDHPTPHNAFDRKQDPLDASRSHQQLQGIACARAKDGWETGRDGLCSSWPGIELGRAYLHMHEQSIEKFGIKLLYAYV